MDIRELNRELFTSLPSRTAPYLAMSNIVHFVIIECTVSHRAFEPHTWDQKKAEIMTIAEFCS